MKIELIKRYRGVHSKEQIWELGIYNVSQVAAENLISKGYAIAHEPDATDTEQSAEATGETLKAHLQAQYETLSGVSPDGRWSIETLQEKVNELD